MAKEQSDEKKSDDKKYSGYAQAAFFAFIALVFAGLNINNIINTPTTQGIPLIFIIFFGALSVYGFLKPEAALKLYKAMVKIGDNWLKGSSNKLSTNGGTSTRDKSIDHSDIGGPANIAEGNNNSTGNTTTNNHYYYTPGTQPPGTETPKPAPKPDLKIDIGFSNVTSKHTGRYEKAISLMVINKGEIPVTVLKFEAKTPDGNDHHWPITDSKCTIPHEIGPHGGVWGPFYDEIWAIAEISRLEGLSGKIELIGYCMDSLGNSYKSDTIEIDVGPAFERKK
jgi:hypothetical protein